MALLASANVFGAVPAPFLPQGSELLPSPMDTSSQENTETPSHRGTSTLQPRGVTFKRWTQLHTTGMTL